MKDFLAKHKGHLVIPGLLVLAAAWFIHANRENLSRESIMAYGESLPASWLIVAFAILPMLGFPISILLVLLGVRFGFTQGMVICALGLAAHHITGYFAVHGALRNRIHEKLKAHGYELPRLGGKNPAWLTLLFAAIHGPPYTLKVYLPALTEIPFRIYFWVGVPVHLAFSAIAIAADESSLFIHEPPVAPGRRALGGAGPLCAHGVSASVRTALKDR